MTNRCPQCGREGHADNDCPFEWMTNVDPGASAPAPCFRCLQPHANTRCDDGIHHGSALPYPQVSTAKEPAAAEVSNLADILPREDHACSTGDCGHNKQSECDETLARDYSELTIGSREFTLHFDENADNPKVRVESKLIKIKFNEVVHVIEKSAYDALKADRDKWQAFALDVRDDHPRVAPLLAEIEKLKAELLDAQVALNNAQVRADRELDTLRRELSGTRNALEKACKIAGLLVEEVLKNE